MKTCKYLSIPGHIVLLESLSRLTFSRLRNENENVSSFYFVNISLNSMYNCDLKYSVKKTTNLPKVCSLNFLSIDPDKDCFSRIIFIQINFIIKCFIAPYFWNKKLLMFCICTKGISLSGPLETKFREGLNSTYGIR